MNKTHEALNEAQFIKENYQFEPDGRMILTYKDANGEDVLKLDKRQVQAKARIELINHELKTVGDPTRLRQQKTRLYKLLPKEAPKYVVYRSPDPNDENKYKLPAGVIKRPHFANKAYYQQDTLIIVEGHKKATLLKLLFEFLGITRFRIVHIDGIQSFAPSSHPELVTYLKMNPNIKTVLFLYDNDYKDLSKKVLSGQSDKSINQRPENFRSSILNAAQSCYDLGLKPYFATVEHEQEKGIDDVFFSLKFEERKTLLRKFANYDVQGVSAEQNSNYNLKNNNYSFVAIRLLKTKLKKQVDSLYQYSKNDALKFVQQYSNLPSAFTFAGTRYKLESGVPFSQSRIKADIQQENVKFESYIPKDFFFTRNEKYLATQAPTGCGKTTAAEHFCIKSKNQSVITVPTKDLALQVYERLSKKTSDVGLITGDEPDKFAESIQKIVICTYDSLRYVEDIEDRILFIDEFHLLSSAENFRSEAVNIVFFSSVKAKQAFFISATPNVLLLSLFNIPLVRFQSRQRRNINLDLIETNRNASEVYLDAVLQQIEKASAKTVIYWNDKAGLKLIEKKLIEKGYSDNEIQTVTADNGQISNEKLNTGTKILLTTCKLREGVNIKSEVGKILIVGKTTITDIVQFVSRFRNISTYDVCLIRPKKAQNNTAWKENIIDDLKANISRFQQEADRLNDIGIYLDKQQTKELLSYNGAIQVNYLGVIRHYTEIAEDVSNVQLYSELSDYFDVHLNIGQLDQNKELQQEIKESTKSAVQEAFNALQANNLDVSSIDIDSDKKQLSGIKIMLKDAEDFRQLGIDKKHFSKSAIERKKQIYRKQLQHANNQQPTKSNYLSLKRTRRIQKAFIEIRQRIAEDRNRTITVDEVRRTLEKHCILEKNGKVKFYMEVFFLKVESKVIKIRGKKQRVYQIAS